MSIRKKTILVYSNLPSGGAQLTYQLSTRYLEKFYVVKRITEPEYNIKNVFHYLYITLIVSPRNQKKLITESGHFDLLVVYQSWLVKSPSVLRYTNKPKLYICHDILREYYDRMHIHLQTAKERLVNLLRFPIKIIDQKNLKSSNTTIVANSIFSQNLIYNYYKRHSIVIYPGIEQFKYHLPSTIKKLNQVISIGSINKLKMQSFFVDILSHIPLSIRPILVLIGNGSEEKYLHSLIEKSKLLGVKIKIMVNATEKKKILELNKSKVFLYSPVNEPFGLAVEEGISAGLPLLIYRKGGGYAEIIGEKMGVILDNLDPQKWAKELTNILTDSELQKKYSDYNIGYATNHLDSNVMNRKIFNLINNLI